MRLQDPHVALHVRLKNDMRTVVYSVNAKPLSPCLKIGSVRQIEKRLGVIFREARYHRRWRQFTPTAQPQLITDAATTSVTSMVGCAVECRYTCSSVLFIIPTAAYK